MAKVSSIQKNIKRQKMASQAYNKRLDLKNKIYNKNLSLEERFNLVMKLAEEPRNSALVRVRNRCKLTGRSRGVFRKFGLSRNMLRKYAGQGMIPGLVKSSW